MKKQKFTALTIDGKGNKGNYSVRATDSDEAAKKMLKQGHFPMVKPEAVVGKLSYAGRQNLSSEDFAIPETRKYPIPDISHARNALARVSQHGTSVESQRVMQAVYTKYPELNKAADQGDKLPPTVTGPTSLKRYAMARRQNIARQGGPEKHFAALGEDNHGQEGIAVVDAPNAEIASVRLEQRGMHPYHKPVEQSLKFNKGNAITQVHDDGDLTAIVNGKKVVVTVGGDAFEQVPAAQAALIKQNLGSNVMAMKARLTNQLERGKLPGAPLVHGVPKLPPSPRRIQVHRTRHGALTRRSDR